MVKDDSVHYILINKRVILFLMCSFITFYSHFITNQSINQVSKNVKIHCLCVCLSVWLWRTNWEHSVGPTRTITLSTHIYTHKHLLSSHCVQLSQTTCFWLWPMHTGVLHFQQQLVALRSLILGHIWHLFLFCWPCVLLSCVSGKVLRNPSWPPSSHDTLDEKT